MNEAQYAKSVGKRQAGYFAAKLKPAIQQN